MNDTTQNTPFVIQDRVFPGELTTGTPPRPLPCATVVAKGVTDIKKLRELQSRINQVILDFWY